MNDNQFEFSETYHVVQDLIWKQLNNEPLHTSEQKMLDDWLAGDDNNKQLFEDLTNNTSLQRELVKYHAAEQEKEALRQQAMETAIPGSTTAVKTKWSGWSQMLAAAIVVLLLSSGIYFFFLRSNHQPEVAKTTTPVP